MGSYPWVIGGVVAAGIIHILAIFGIPALAERDAWSRLSTALQPNTLAVGEEKSGLRLPFAPPETITAYCLFNISERNLIVRAPLKHLAWSLAISTASGENFYLVTGADTKKSEARILLIRRDRLSEEAATEKTSDGDDQSIVIAPSRTGFIVIRAPIEGESFRREALSDLKNARCELQPLEPVVAAVAEPTPPAEVKSPPITPQGRSRHYRTR